ncbi:DNA primase, partial [candidate division WWE3 bacterium]|nr:DNA primase [candidate division WWE3 bacterium]
MDKLKFEEIKNRLSIVEFVSSYVSLTKSGKNYKGLCPFHQEKTPSFMVSPELQIFKCFACGKAGDVFTFLMEIEGLDFVAAVKRLADKAGVKIELSGAPRKKDRKDTILEINHLAAEFYHYLLLKHKVGEKALDYLKSERKLSDDTILSFKIGYSPNSWRSLHDFLVTRNYRIEDLVSSGLVVSHESGKAFYDRFRGRIVFPIKNISGEIVGFSARILGKEEPKYINTPETEVFNKGSVLFALDKAKVSIKREGFVLLVEGQMDAIGAHQDGFVNTVATSGTSLTQEQLKVLKKLAPDIYFCFDSDAAGVEAAKRGIELAEGMDFNMKVVVIPKPFKDLDESLRSDFDGVKKALQNAVSLYDFYFIRALGKFSPDDPIGKKKIAEILVPVLGGIRNPIVKEYFVSKLAGTLAVSEGSVLAMIKTISPTSTGASSHFPSNALKNEIERLPVRVLKGVPLQEYLISLVLKAPLDLASTSLYKLG